MTLEQFNKQIILPQDKANHLAYGLLVYSVISVWSSLLAVGIVIVVATAKEVWDYYGHGTCDKWDWVATISFPLFIEILRNLI